MTAEALGGLVGLNGLFLAAGCGVLWALRGWDAWSELLRLAGVAYLLGVASVVVVVTELLVIGVTLSVAVVVGVSLGLLALGLALGRLQRRRLPRSRLGGIAREPFLTVGVAAAAVSVVLLEATFRVARLQPIVAWDVWAFWGQKGKAIYFFGGLDEQLFSSLPGSTYPVFVPTLHAAVYHFVGAADATTVHVQFWVLLAAFVGAVAGLLRPHVALSLVWPFLALLLVFPELQLRVLNPQADWALDFFFVVSALCLASWLQRREPWLLVATALFLGAAMSTKREGQLLTACLLAAALAATARHARWAWPRLLATGAGGFALTLPWQVWYRSHGLHEERPLPITQLLDYADRAWPSFRVVMKLFFSYELWLVAAPLGLLAAAIALLAGARLVPSFYLAIVGLAIAGFTWILWSHTTLPIDTSDGTPIPRAIGSIALLSVAFAPLLLAEALERRRPPT